MNSSANSQNTKRIAKNTILLYGRMLLMMAITLYTSRVTLKALGVDDYGTYNVVGGVVSMFTLLSGSLSAAISRFFTFELGKQNTDRLRKVFSTSINIQCILIIIIVILLETIGLWFVYNKLVIPPDRLDAAVWVFHFSVITFSVNLWSIPYNAAIIAHEKMSAFAYISIFEAVAKLIIVFLIVQTSFDRLILYGFLVMFVGICVRFIYGTYCKRHFKECSYKCMFDKELMREMFGFAGWNFIGASSAVLRDQGGNILINLFFGPAVNAARGVAMQVSHAVNGFVKNFMIALNPQITKSYAVGDYDYMFKLVFQGARLSFYILLLLALPIILTTPYLMHLWLDLVPDHAVNFARLVLIFTMCESLSGPLITVMLATGKIRNYQLLVGGIQTLNLPVSYIFLKSGAPSESVFIIAIILSLCCDIARLFMLRSMVGLSIRQYVRKVFINVITVTFSSILIPVLYLSYYPICNFTSFLACLAITCTSTILMIYYLGCNKEDRNAIKHIVIKIKNRRNVKDR